MQSGSWGARRRRERGEESAGLPRPEEPHSLTEPRQRDGQAHVAGGCSHAGSLSRVCSQFSRGGGQDIHTRGEGPQASLMPCPLVPCLRAASALPHLQTLNKGLRRSGFSGQPEQATLLSEGQGGKALSRRTVPPVPRGMCRHQQLDWVG